MTTTADSHEDGVSKASSAMQVRRSRGEDCHAPQRDETRSAGANDGSDSLDTTQVERLGRQRPVVFSSGIAESAFICTIVVSMMMGEYFISGFNIILPFVARDIGIPASARTWPAAVINLTIAALLLPFSRLGDRFGGRLVFLFGQAWYFVWSLACGFVGGTNTMIVCRAMQGVGAAAFTPAGLALLGQIYRPGRRKNVVFGLYGAFAVIGFYFGIIVGGVSAQLLKWQWFFWIGAVLSFATAVSGLVTIPRNLGGADKSVNMDWWGTCTIVPAVTLIVFALTDAGHAPRGWKTPYICITMVLGGLLLCAAVYVEGWVSAQPLLPAGLFRPRYMKRLVLSLFCCYGVFGLYLFYASFYLETILHTGPLQTAAWFTPMAVGGLALAVGGGFVLHRLPSRILMIVSGIGFLVSVLLFAVMPEQSAAGMPTRTFLFWAYVFPAMVAGTTGIDITFNVTNVYITTAMPRRLQGAASGLINSILFLGISFWLGVGELAISVTIELSPRGSVSLLQQYRIGMWTGVALAALSLCATATVRMGQASAALTADEKERLESEQEMVT